MSPDKPHLLVIDDEKIALHNLQYVLKKEGYEVTARQSGAGGLKCLEEGRFDAVLTDLKMEGVDGIQILRRARELYPDLPVIIITGHATLTSAVAAIKDGAFHYVAKPFRLDEVRHVIKSALERNTLKRENTALREQLRGFQGQTGIITHNTAMLRLLETARQVAASGCNVLITGESGTGKELLARYLHRHGNEAHGPFLAINCGAFSDQLLAAELFGHEKGAFTGAVAKRTGLIAAAAGGTLFLDEVTEMSPVMQVKLLRVVQEREVLPVGSTTPVTVDVRFIAASNRNIAAAVSAGHFRQDLYFRLNVVNLALPPLSDRRDDIPLLSHYFLAKYAALMHKEVTEIEPEAMHVLTHYAFPGNVRELSNLIERGVALATGKSLLVAHLPDDIRTLNIRAYREPDQHLPTLEAQEKEYIQWVLEQTRGNRTQAAQILGIDRVSLWRKLKRYGLAE